MSKRNRTSEQLTAYLDGELAEGEVRRLEQALSSDPELAKELAGLKATRALVRSLPRADAPAGFREAVLDRVSRRALTTPSRPGPAWWLTAAVAAVVLVAVGVGMYAVWLVGSYEPAKVAVIPDTPERDESVAVTDVPGKAETELAAAPRADVAKPGAAVPEVVEPEVAKPVVAKPEAPVGRVAKGGSEDSAISKKSGGKRAESEETLAANQPPAPPLAPKGGGQLKDTDATPTIYIPVNTTNLAQAERMLQGDLARNRLQARAEQGGAFPNAKEAPGGGQRTVTLAVPESQLAAVVNDIDGLRQRQNVNQSAAWADELALADTPDTAGLKALPAQQVENFNRGNLYREILQSQRARQRQAAAGQALPTGRQALAQKGEDQRETAAVGGQQAPQRTPDAVQSRLGPGKYDDGGLARGKVPGDEAPARKAVTQDARKFEEHAHVVQPVEPAQKGLLPVPVVPGDAKAAEQTGSGPSQDQFGAGAGRGAQAAQAPGPAAADGEKPRRDTQPQVPGQLLSPAAEVPPPAKAAQAAQADKPKSQAAAGRPASRPASGPADLEKSKLWQYAQQQGDAAKGSREKVYNICVIFNDVSVDPRASKLPVTLDAAPGPQQSQPTPGK